MGGYGLAVDDVLAALEREHVELPGGRLETDEREWTLRTEGKFTSAEQFGALAVDERRGSVIHLRDVATVEDGMADERTISRLNGRRGVALQVRRQSGENTVAVANAVKREVGIRDEDGEPLYVINKENKNSPRKIDIDMAGILSWEARNDAIAAGVLEDVGPQIWV